MIEDQDEEVALLEESKRVPNYLTSSFHHFSHIFGVSKLHVHIVDKQPTRLGIDINILLLSILLTHIFKYF